MAGNVVWGPFPPPPFPVSSALLEELEWAEGRGKRGHLAQTSFPGWGGGVGKGVNKKHRGEEGHRDVGTTG